MPRRMLAPIVAIKHYVQEENASLASAARKSIDVVTAVGNTASISATDEVLEGSIVKAIFSEYWFKSDAVAGSGTKFQLVYEKVPSGGNSINFTQMNNLMAYPNKKNILYYTQGVVGDLTTNSIPMIRNWFKVPKGKQRMGIGDTITVSVSTTGAAADICGFSTYKEYR